jgi:hypothetical protein
MGNRSLAGFGGDGWGNPKEVYDPKSCKIGSRGEDPIPRKDRDMGKDYREENDLVTLPLGKKR